MTLELTPDDTQRNRNERTGDWKWRHAMGTSCRWLSSDPEDQLAEAQAEIIRLRAKEKELVEALTVLSEEAAGFNVSGVYFSEECMGHEGLKMAEAALCSATETIRRDETLISKVTLHQMGPPVRLAKRR